MNTTQRITVVLFLILLTSSTAFALAVHQPNPEGLLKNITYRSDNPVQQDNTDAASAGVVFFPGDSVTQGSAVIDGETIEYTARAGTLPLADAEGHTLAKVFYISYTKKGVTDVSARPLLFSFNGGPGSASIWMHIGLLGPRRVKLGDGGGVKRDHSLAQPVPPAGMIDNEYSMLDVADLVLSIRFRPATAGPLREWMRASSTVSRRTLQRSVNSSGCTFRGMTAGTRPNL